MEIYTHKLNIELEQFCNELENVKELSQTTVKNYYESNKLFIKWLKDNNIEKLDKPIEYIKEYSEYLKIKRNMNKNSRKTYLTQIIQFLRYLKLDLDDNELKKSMPKVNGGTEPKYLDMEEIQEIMKTIPENQYRDRAIVQTLYKTGLRVSELVNLKKSDLNLESEEEIIALKVISGKGGKNRTIYLDKDTLNLINTMMYKRQRKNNKDISEYLFQSKQRKKKPKQDKPLTTRSIEAMIKKYAIATDERLAKEGIKDDSDFKERLTPHALRHSYAIYLLNTAKRPINEVQKLLGHTNIATTGIYSNLKDEVLKSGYSKVKWNEK